MPSAADPLVATVLFPFDIDPAQLSERLSAIAGHRVRVNVTPYLGDDTVRMAKDQATSDEELAALRDRDAPLSEEVRAALGETDVLLALDTPIDLIEVAPRLRWVQAASAGVTRHRLKRLAEHDIALTSASGIIGDVIAEFVIARVLEIALQLRRFDEQQREHVWRMGAMHPVGGTTMAVIGLGGIGGALADRAAAFGIQVIGVRRDPAKGAPPSVAEVVGADDLHAVLPRADWVVVAAPSTADTESLIDDAALAAMKPTAVLVNVARGSLVDEQALIAALQDGRIAAAALDVTRTEPLPPDDPLWDTPNLYLSPHTSGTTTDYSDRLVDLFADNLARLCAGETLRNLVDPDLGY